MLNLLAENAGTTYKKMEEKRNIKVRIQVRETVIYDQERMLTQSEFDDLEAYDGDDINELSNRDAYATLDSVLDRRDVLSNEGEFSGFSIEEIK